MIIFAVHFLPALQSLREILLNNHFDLVVRELKISVTYFQEPGFIYYGHSIEKLLAQLSKRQRLLIRLFALQQSVSRDQLRKELFSGELIDSLVALGLLLEHDGQLRTDEYAIAPYLDCFFIATIGTARSIGAYLGRQSYILAANIFQERQESLLDLGSGCGVLAILAAKQHGKAVGVDILPEAVEVSKANAALNGVEERVEFYCGDLYQPVAVRQFDTIIANAPYVALPNKYKDMVAIASGEDGLGFMRLLINGIHPHQPKIARLIANGLGNDKQPLLLNILDAKGLADKGYQAKIYIYSKGFLDDIFIDGVAKLVEGAYRDRGAAIERTEILQSIKQLYRQQSVDYYYGIILELLKLPSRNAKPTQIEQIDISNRFNLTMSPNFRSPMEIIEDNSWLARIGNTTLPLTDIEKEYLSTLKTGASNYELVQGEKINLYSRLAQVFGQTE